MNVTLEKIATQNHMFFDDYVRGYDSWKAATETQKNDFYILRKKHVLQFGGVFFDQASVIKTTGTSTGLIKKYLWGPNFSEAHNFHDYLCCGDLESDLILETFFKTQPAFALNPNYNQKNRFGCQNYNLMCFPSKENFEEVDKFTKEKTNKKTIIKILPTQAFLIISKKEKFFEFFDPQRYVFFITGETCHNDVKNYFKDLDLELRDSMKVWNGGASFYTCKYGNLHWNDFTCLYHKDETNDKQLICTDLFNLAQIFHKTPTGDLVEIKNTGFCNCGLVIQENIWQDKFSSITLNGHIYNWMELRNQFVVNLSELCYDMNFWWQNLLALSVGISKNSICIFYEVKQEIQDKILNDLQKKLETKWSKKVSFEKGLKTNGFKTKRVFYMDEERKVF